MASPDPEHDAEYLAQYAAQSRRLVEDLRQAHAAIQRLEARVADDDGLVEAAAAGGGTLTRLRFDPRALRLGEAELGRRVTAVLRAAQDEALRQAQEIAADAESRAAVLPEPLDEAFVRGRVERAARDLL